MHHADPTETFRIEADELLGQIEEIALDVSKRPDDAEAINRLFRAFHTIKGSGAMFGFDAVAEFTHHVENALDRVRDGSLAVTPRLIELILAAKDEIKALLERPQGAGSGLDTPQESIIAEIDAMLGTAAPVPVAQPSPAASSPVDASGAEEPYRIRFKPPAGIALSGLDPMSLLDELRGLGRCTINVDTASVPALDSLKAEECHFVWNIALATDKGLNAIKDVFIFVEDESEIAIERVCRADDTAEIPREPATTRLDHPAAPEAARVIPEQHEPACNPAVRKTPAKDSIVRVPSEKLDRLVNLVGEMVMNQSRLSQVASRIGDADLAVPVEAIERLVAEMRDSVLGIRMMPIGSTFSRFKRLVHDLSRELQKEIELVTEGAETELDKTVLDQLGDPLVHLIRNSIDHGIELPDTRTAAGKPRVGTIRLAASHEGSHVVVKIQDDGRGIDAGRVRAKAVEKKLIAADASLTEKEIFGLIFLPGFSTASEVTSVSGRGVGMDVVKKQLDALRGGIQVASAAGRGTTITLTLPLTLAIIEGLLVEIAGDQFIVPMSVVAENVELESSERSRNNGRNVIAVRGELVPYIRLREVFTMPGEGPAVEKVVLVRHAGERVGLVVDRVLGSHQTVIQALGRFYRDIEVLSGATIMGDGRVALILDVAGVVRFVEHSHELQEA